MGIAWTLNAQCGSLATSVVDLLLREILWLPTVHDALLSSDGRADAIDVGLVWLRYTVVWAIRRGKTSHKGEDKSGKETHIHSGSGARIPEAGMRAS